MDAAPTNRERRRPQAYATISQSPEPPEHCHLQRFKHVTNPLVAAESTVHVQTRNIPWHLWHKIKHCRASNRSRDTRELKRCTAVDLSTLDPLYSLTGTLPQVHQQEIAALPC